MGRPRQKSSPDKAYACIAEKEGTPAMAVERTLSIIKPDATARNVTGKINAFLEEGGLRIVAQKRLRLSRQHAQKFYEVHAERAFYDELCEYMSSGAVVVQVLEGENAIARNRDVMGATNPANAADGTIRKALGLNVQENSVHGSDSPENAVKEIQFFFSDIEIVG
jgi:nucleoside-diphosphate kinase